MKKIVRNILIGLGFIVVFFNIFGSKRWFFVYNLLSDSKSSLWEILLESFGKSEREYFLSCCVGEDIKKRFFLKQREIDARIAQLERSLDLNPYAWQVMLELSDLYFKKGDKERSIYYRRKATETVPLQSFLYNN